MRASDVHSQQRRVETRQLVRISEGDDVARAKPANQARPELLVSSTEQKALATDDPEHQPSPACACDESEDLLLAEVTTDKNTIEDGIDPEGRAFQAEFPQNATCRRARTEEIERVCKEFFSNRSA